MKERIHIIFDWSPVPNTPMEVCLWRASNGGWICAGRWADTKQEWGSSWQDNPIEAIIGVLGLVNFTIKVAEITAKAS